jgi:organic hydroperoxide reductase OsmC/OhrA
LHLYTAQIHWERGPQPFTDNRYSRLHRWRFDGGAEVPGSSSPLSVKVPMSDPAAVDPEEAFVASISSCHMLFFLGFAARDGFVVDRYTDEAQGVMEKNSEGKVAITRVTLRPEIVFSGAKLPTPVEIAHLHHESHEKCYIANSVKAEVVVETRA